MFLRSISVCVVALLLSATAYAQGKPPRLQPTRLYSIGDSITTAFDSNLILDNAPESWVNGFSDFGTQLFGYEDIQSHNQRIDAAFGVSSNVNGAANGARMDDIVGQATSAVANDPYYVTVLLGGNDICRDSPTQVPGMFDYVFDFIDGALVLDKSISGNATGLTPGSTVYVSSVPDIKQLYDVGQFEQGLFGIDCPAIWLTTLIGFPCGSMLNPLNAEGTRLYLQAINYQYNLALEFVVNFFDPASQELYWDFTWSVWNYQFQGADISSIDCFHPSTQGQRALAEGTWADGPFQAF